MRVAVLNGILVVLVGLAWFYAVPARIGGFTTYVVTHGVSMEPRFHSGDLALVRPASHYKVGEIVAYRSSLLHELVMHRIVAINGGHYTFKGDNNNFLDPVHPTRSQLIGKLWLHVPRGAVVLEWLHSPVVDGVICGLLGLFLLYGFGEKERRRRRRRRIRTPRSSSHGPLLVNTPRDQNTPRLINFGAMLAASALAGVAFLGLAVFAFTRPAHRAVRRTTTYTQQMRFGYSARVPAGPVYPNGRIKTNDPIFLSIVHSLDVHIAYKVAGPDPSTLAGTEEVLLHLTGPSGWTRTFVLAPRTRFAGDETGTDVTLNLSRVESLMAEIARLTATPGFGSFALTVQPVVHITGTVSDRPVRASYSPALGFQLQSDELQPTGGSASTGNTSSAAATSGQANYTPSQSGSVSHPAAQSNAIGVLGVSVDVRLLRWMSLLGLLLSVAATLYFYLRKRGEPFEESVRIQAQHGHLIVPIIAGEDLGWPPVDVPNIKALVRLAESGQRLILHNRSGDVDTYMVNDEGTVYRYQVRSSRVVWGEWTDAPVPVDHPTAAAEAA
ncbi:MAG TPA: signal peptidase I [Solirubrobacteraceae bacterium]|nr:signal peptidase I [Solirubrobacteraceae bacterium]